MSLHPEYINSMSSFTPVILEMLHLILLEGSVTLLVGMANRMTQV